MSFLDLILIAFLLFMFFSGYSKGFFSTLYDLLSFIIMMLFIYLNVETISSIIQIYKPVDDPLSQLGGSVVNMLIVFIIMFIILEIIRRLIGLLIKPLITKLTDHFALTSIVNHVLGALLHGLKGAFIAFLAMVMFIVPFFGPDILADSKIGHLIIEDVPIISETVLNEASAYGSLLKGQHNLQLEDKDILRKMIIANNHAYDHGLLDEHDAIQFIYTQLGPALIKQQVTLPKEEKIQFILLLNKTPYTETEKNIILNNIGSE